MTGYYLVPDRFHGRNIKSKNNILPLRQSDKIAVKKGLLLWKQSLNLFKNG
jgi:hypothetical protein